MMQTETTGSFKEIPMRRPNQIADSNTRTLLALGAPEYQETLSEIFSGSGWRVRRARSISEAALLVSRNPVDVAIVESSLPDGAWRDFLSQCVQFGQRPRVIVTSRLADEYLWAEVLNLGGYDVLAQPFEVSEVRRCAEAAVRDVHLHAIAV